jgi:hypothetical protein
MTNDHDRLERIEQDLGMVREHIAHERRFIREVEIEGHSTRLAQRTLHGLHHFRDAIRRHRRILLERLGLYRA